MCGREEARRLLDLWGLVNLAEALDYPLETVGWGGYVAGHI